MAYCKMCRKKIAQEEMYGQQEDPTWLEWAWGCTLFALLFAPLIAGYFGWWVEMVRKVTK